MTPRRRTDPARRREVAPRQEPIIPRAGSARPGVANLRIIGPPDVVDATLQSLADFYGELWQPGTRKPSRTSNDDLVYGTLIVPVPTTERPPS